MFFPLLKTVLNSSILMPFSASAIFVSPLPHQQNIYFWGCFSSGETKISRMGWNWVNRECEAWDSCRFGSKTAEHSVQHGQVHVERIFKKNSLKLNTASHNHGSWYSVTVGFLGHSPSGGSPWGAHPPEDNSILGGSPTSCIWKQFPPPLSR